MKDIPWVAGWGGGVTGPTAPSVTPTVSHVVALIQWENAQSKGQAGQYPVPSQFYALVTRKDEGESSSTIAIIPARPGDEHKEIAKLVAASRELLKACQIALENGALVLDEWSLENLQMAVDKATK